MTMANVPATSWNVFADSRSRRSPSSQTRQTCVCCTRSKNGTASGSPIPSRRSAAVPTRQRVTSPSPSPSPPGTVSHERIGFLLVADRRHGAVAGIDDRLGRQGEQLGADALDQEGAVAVGEIGAADT